MVRTCKSLKIDCPTNNTIIKMRNNGYVAKDIIAIHLENNKNRILLKEFLTARNRFLKDEQSMNYLKIKKNTKLVLKYLERKKINRIICTVRKKRRPVEKFLKEKKIEHYFSMIYCMEDLGFDIDNVSIKNRILIKKSLLKKGMIDNKMKSGQIIYVGNSSEDLEAATKMKIRFIYYQNNYLEKLHDAKIKKIKSMFSLKNEIKKIINES